MRASGVRMPWKLSGSAETTLIGAGALPAQVPEQLNRFGKGELLAGETGDESAAAHFAAELQSAIGARQAKPVDGQFFSVDRPPEDYAGAAKKLPRRKLVQFIRLARRCRRSEATPPADGTNRRPAPRRRGDHLPQGGKRIAGRHAARHQIRQPHLKVRGHEVGGLLQMLWEHRAASSQRVEQVAGRAAHSNACWSLGHAQPGVNLFARDKADRRHSNRCRSAAPKSSPGELAAHRHVVEPFALVIANAPLQDVALPRPRRKFESRQLAQHLTDSARTFEPVFFVDVLPAGEELKELIRADGLYFLSESVERVAVDACQQASLAPGGSTVQARPEDRAFVFELHQQGVWSIADGDARIVLKHRSQRLEPAQQHFSRLTGAVDREPSSVFVHHSLLACQRAEPAVPIHGLCVRHKADP